MNVQLPDDLQNFIQEQVRSGRYRSADDAIRDAVDRLRSAPPGPCDSPPHDPVLGSMREAAAEMDEIVEQAMKDRRRQRWRTTSGE